ncbi:MAG TPA: alpha-L-arabinofuranosidase C-terminal domain-containing protein [Sphingomonas sp.]|uniref:alpha-N-arabinofuranosidase n=1 Tax=Sphingomonas sp. TaxID=28214 RepID=UPI002CF75186|nr:alpha-L-arabinofuranosidase C-terminal domain-containing protein [Sphingomonas sp.]HMI20505.1 alpha-L-arabinofuranosidase C-terminal domain-containing protein [Sphingomonas sp.]
MPGPQINRQIFGQFAEHLGHGIYGGIWVGPKSKIANVHGYRKDVVDALKDLSVPFVRWPGGCFADEYHWRDGVGPAGKRPVKVNTWWGGVTEDNSFGTHEYFGFLDQIGAEAYISGNVGNAPPREMAEWIEYMTSPTGSSFAQERAANGHPAPFKLSYFGLGNELWGCGGNMRAEYAADETRRYATFIKPGGGAKLMKIASGPSDSDYNWTEVMMREAAKNIDGLTLHYYTITGPDWQHKGAATGFTESEWAATLAKTLRMDEYLTRHSAIMDKYDPAKRVWLVVDEWGAWYDPAPGSNPGFLVQQNSLRDALLAASNINIFVKHADRVKMAAIAQMVNVLQAMILTDGPRMVKTPSYYVFQLYKPFQDATQLPIEVTSSWYGKDQWTMPAVSAAAARDKAGVVHIALTNMDPNQPATVSAKLAGLTATNVSGRIITAPAMDAVNSFDRPDTVVPQPFTGALVSADGLTVTLPPKSVVMLDLR